MRVTWLGQAGLFFDNGKEKVMIDPYFSDSVEKVNPKNFRRVPVREELFDIEPDVMIFTHDHLDHYDPQTASVFLAEDRKPMTVLCPFSVWQKVRAYGGPHNYVLFDRYTQWTQGNLRFRAVKAAHSDAHAIGAVIEELDGGKTYYVTGDTLYNEEIFADLPEGIDGVFLPVNGVGNNMNMTDAKQFCEKIRPRVAVPLHIGMFDELDGSRFAYENKIIPELYKEIQL